MKKIFYLFSAALMALAIGCTDDEIIEQGPIFPVDENEVPFGAGEGAFNTGEKSAKGGTTRTIYELKEGDNANFENYTELIVSWLENDPIRVYSPEAPEGYKTADYKVTPQLDGGEGSYGHGGFLMKVGKNGIHWGSGETQRFFAFYPGNDTFLPDPDNNLKTSGKFTHTIPVAQERGVEVSYDSSTGKPTLNPGLDGAWKIISPDMTFCNMVADTTYNPKNTTLVNLQFYPLVTVLDVVITGNDKQTYDIIGVSVKSKTQDIVGTYTYDFEKPRGQRITFNDSKDETNKTAYIDCMHDQTPLSLGPGSNLNVKFFLLPRDINAQELSIEVLCEGGYVLRKSLNKDVNLKAGKVIKIRTPKISLGKTNNWMSMIDDNVYFASQLSLPGAKHAYSYTTLDAGGNVHSTGGQAGMGKTQEPVIDAKYNTQKGMMPFYQTMSIEDMFNSGVRAFDIKVITDSGTAKIFAAGQETKTTLVDFLNTLKGLIQGDQPTATEGVVVNINFAYSKDSNQSNWVRAIKTAVQTYDPDGSTLRKVTSETTMQEMRGHIGIMIHYNGNDTFTPKYVGILRGFDTSVQNVKNTVLPLGGTGRLHLQNLYQVNNPEITDANMDGVRPTVGLCPHFILRENMNNGTSVDLIAKKKELLKELLDESQKENGALTQLFMNDLSGFCVVDDNSSTGWGVATGYKCDGDFLGSPIWGTKENIPVRDQQYVEKHYTKPTNPKKGDVYFVKDAQMTDNGGAPEKGNGGNTALFAQEINNYAQEEIYNVVEKGRAPLGIVYMNFAGVRTLTVGGKKYNVNGINLPSMIMSNNFKFALKKKESVTPAQ